jgi:hypothetical protein
MKKTYTKIKNNQEGVVTIVVVILIILLMSLIVLAMSRNASREQRQSLDNQLNTQAFYAAESGINEFMKQFNDLPDEDETCDNSLAGPLLEDSVIEITCVLYDKTPPTLDYDDIPLHGSKVIPIQSDDEIDVLNLSFESSSSAAEFSGCSAFNGGTFPRNPVDNCDAGVLRISIVRSNNPNRQNLFSETSTIFVVPGNSSNPTYSLNSGDQGEIVRAHCASGNTPRKCKVNISNLKLNENNRIYLNVRSIYTPNSLGVASTDTESFKNAQVIIDSTGKANDVLKRLRTAVPIHGPSISAEAHAPFSIQTSTDVCKLLEVRPGSTTSGCSL